MSMTLIQHIELGSNQASITFSSIPATFTDLLLVTSLRSTSTAGEDGAGLRFNGSTSGYSARTLSGDGASANSETNPFGVTNFGFAGFTGTAFYTANTFANAAIYIPNYRSSVAKSYSVDSVSENNGTRAIQVIVAGLHTGTSAITEVSVTCYGGRNFITASSATLYGITSGSAGGVTVT